MLGPFATRAAARPFSRCRYRYCRAPPAHRCPRLQQQRRHTTTRDRGDRFVPMEWAQQEAFEKCWAHSPLQAAACRLFYIAIHQVSLLSHAATVARCLRIDVHNNIDNNDNNGNACQRGPLWPHRMGPITGTFLSID